MIKGIVGILGSTGHVGKELLRLLEVAEESPSILIRLGGRKTSDADKSRYECFVVDIMNENSLSNFCKGCSVIVNCSGPSALYAIPVMNAAACAGANYIDAFGGAGEKLSHSIIEIMRKFPLLTLVTGAGVFPGLSEVLPRAIASCYFDKVERLFIAAGGLELCSWAGGSDLLVSAITGYGSIEGKDREQIIGFPTGWVAKPYQSSDFKRLSHILCCNDSAWYSVFSSTRVSEVIAIGCNELATQCSLNTLTISMLESVVEPLISVAKQELAGRETWYKMMIEVNGRINGEPVLHRAMLTSNNSYALTAYMLYQVLLKVLTGNVFAGHYPADEIVDCNALYLSLLSNDKTNCQYYLKHVRLPGEINIENESGIL